MTAAASRGADRPRVRAIGTGTAPSVVEAPSRVPPAPLGRGAIVGYDQASPGHLAEAPRIVIDEAVTASPGPVVDRLHRRWVARDPVVIELRVPPSALTEPATSSAPVHSHDPRFLFGLDRLRHLVWANNVDWRSGSPVWWHTTKAVRAVTGLTAGGPADVVLPDGRPAWVDGGPRQPLDLTEDVLHRDDTERGTLAVIGRVRASGPGPDLLAEDGRDTVGPNLDALAEDQRAAVAAPEGAVRVAAPAGSGKTRVLTARLVEVLGSRGTPADSVLALAYNTGAAAELRARVGVKGARVATVHAHALGLLRRHLGDVEVLDEREVRRILQGLIEVPRRANVDPYQSYIDALETVRTALVAPDVVQDGNDDIKGFPELFDDYRDALRQRGAVDFPEMVYRAIELLLTDPDARAAEQARAGQVLVDEFQDLTPAYLLFIRLLASPQLQCFGVGDDDQVIYGHAGATPTYLLHFDTLFPGASDHPLTVNYRCPAPVVEGAVQLLSHNEVRLDKLIRPGPGAADTSINVRRVDRHAEAASAGEVVAAALDAGRNHDEIAVLARVRVALLGAQAELSTRGIPTRSPIGDWLLQRTGVRAALAYLRIACEDRIAGDDLAEILHRPLRPIPGTVKDTFRGRRWSTDQLTQMADGMPPGGPRRAMQSFVRDLEVLRRRAARQPTAEVLRYVTDVVGLADVAESLDARADQSSGAASSHLDDLAALVQVADHCPDPAQFPLFLTEVVTQPPADGPAVRLSTIHSVKGLEWPEVVVVGASEGIVPHRLAASPAQMEEERRVFHVAITRATRRLTIIAPKTGTSRFVAETLGEPSVVAAKAAPRPRAGKVATKAAKRPAKRAGAPKRLTYRATPGLEVRASGGLAGTVETVTDDGALVRTARGSLLRVRYGSEVRVDGALGTLTAP